MNTYIFLENEEGESLTPTVFKADSIEEAFNKLRTYIESQQEWGEYDINKYDEFQAQFSENPFDTGCYVLDQVIVLHDNRDNGDYSILTHKSGLVLNSYTFDSDNNSKCGYQTHVIKW